MAHPTPIDDRKASILRAIVSHYVRYGEPAGSKTLVEKYSLGVSPATVRNEMGALEEAGYLYQPHTSAGRIPTDTGYRYFVDAWASDPTLSAADSRTVQTFFGEPRWELQDALRETASLLSGLTRHAAVVFTPPLERSLVRKVELVRLTGERAMLLLVTQTGRVENHVIGIPSAVDDVLLDQAAHMLNRLVEDQPLEDAGSTIAANIERFPLELREAATNVVGALEDEISHRDMQRVFLEGASHIVDQQNFTDLETVRQVISALEHRRLVLEVLADGLSAGRVSVRIGSENVAEEMQHCAVIAAPYGLDGNSFGSLGVIGPTRMDYKRTIAAVQEVAGSLGTMLGELGL